MRFMAILLNLVSGFQSIVTLGKERLKAFIANLILLMIGAMIVAGLILAAAGFIFFGFYQFLLVHCTAPLAALFVSLSALILAGIIIAILNRRINTPLRS